MKIKIIGLKERKINNIDKYVIKDITGIEILPGNLGKDCLGNGEHFDSNGNIIECCCDECDYLQYCIDEKFPHKQ